MSARPARSLLAVSQNLSDCASDLSHRADRVTAETEARILEATRQGPTDGTTHWSSYRLAKELGISQSSVSRVWRHFGIQPHRVSRYMASGEAEFVEKAADMIGLYLKALVIAGVFCVV